MKAKPGNYYGETIHSIDPTNCPAHILDRSLYSLGWNIGSYISVVKMDNENVDELGFGPAKMLFTFSGDKALMLKTGRFL